MIQIYFFLVLTNIVGGLILVRQGIKKPFTDRLELFFQFFKGPYPHFCLGLLTFITGFLGLIFVLPGDQIFLGDLVPSLTALFAGTALVLGFYEKGSTQTEIFQRLDDIILKNKMIIGLLSIVSGMLHFIFPTTIFL